MDHLPSLSDPYEPVVVPYLGGHGYDGLDFAGFPARQGWDISKLKAGDLQGRTKAEATQFLQAWLYFGMLYETFKVREDDGRPSLRINDFLRYDEKSMQAIITTASLSYRLKSLYKEIRQLKDIKEYYTRFRSCMDLACGVWRDLIDLSTATTEPMMEMLSPEILLSIQILGAALDIGICEIFGSRSDYTWRVVPRSTWLMNRMIGQGWCPVIVDQLSRPCATFLYFASLLGPPRLGDDHTSCSFGDRVCVASNVDDGKKHVAKHVTDTCNCNFIEIPTGDGSEVATAITDDNIPKIPIIHLRDDGLNFEVKIHSYSSANPIPYTALSHVWCDGLGNPNDNKLHYCQMKRLAKLITSLPKYSASEESKSVWIKEKPRTAADVSECYFWMDTLCVPVKNDDLRQKAIVKMRDVYESASNVLVLDAELMNHSAERDYREIFTRISCSNWLRRLWTLQEALLNKNVLFQFSDRAIYVGTKSKLYEDQQYDNKSRPWDLVAWECNRYDFDIQRSTSNLALRMLSIWDAIGFRTTSRSGDEPLCLAILLQLDVQTLQEEPDSCTVKKFWSLHPNGVPASIIFMPGPKLQIEGYGWAPASLMDLKIMGNDMSTMATVTPYGLFVNYPALRLAQLSNMTESVIACEVDNVTLYIRVITRDNSPSAKGMDLHKRENLGVLIFNLFPSESSDAGGLGSGLGVLVQSQHGVLGRSLECRVKYLRFVSFTKKGSYADHHPNIPYAAEEKREKGLPPVKAVLLDRQMWCVT